MAKKDFSKAEQDFQIAQNHYEIYRDKQSRDKMFMLIQAAAFNALNKKLEKIVPKEEIENYSMDITLNILRATDNKIKKNKPWKIAKVSSVVHKFCFVIYDKQKHFEDRITSFDKETNDEELDFLETEQFVYDEGLYKIV